MTLHFDGYVIGGGVLLLREGSGEGFQMQIGEFVNRDDLIAKLSPEDALRIGSWHGAYIERKHRREESD